MTIALVINVNEGAVIASDSASALMASQGTVANVYNNANKIFNLSKGLPIGVVTFGLGSIGPYSIALLAKELREVLSKTEQMHLIPEDYLLSGFAEMLKKFMLDDNMD